MYKLSKDYTLLYQLIQTGNVVCFVNYDYLRNGVDFLRDICQCKKKKQEIVFVSRGHEYGSVSEWNIDEKYSEFLLFVKECNSLDVEFIPF
jgi:hypothetical protein